MKLKFIPVFIITTVLLTSCDVAQEEKTVKADADSGEVKKSMPVVEAVLPGSMDYAVLKEKNY